MNIRPNCIPLATTFTSQTSLTPRSSSELASTQFAQAGPIVAGVLGSVSGILLVLLVYRMRQKYTMHAPMAKPRWFRLFGRKRQHSPFSYWDEYLWEKDSDLEAFPRRKENEPQPPNLVAFADRPLPTVPAVTRAYSPQDESDGAPLIFPRPPLAPSNLSSATSPLNVGNPSRSKLRVRPDPMLIQQLGMLAPSGDQMEDRRRHDLAGYTPARRSYVGIPPPVSALHPPVPPGLGYSHDRSDNGSSGRLATPIMRATRLRSCSNLAEQAEANSPTERRSRSSTHSAVLLSPIPGRSTTIFPPNAALTRQHMSRHELTLSLYETQDAVAALEDLLSVPTIDIPPSTSHSRFSSTNNTNDFMHAEVEILRREIQRLQTLLLTSGHDPLGNSWLDRENEPNPPPVYTS